MPRATPVTVEGRSLALSNLDKVLYPAAGFTKAQVIEYHLKIAPVLLPHLAGRPLTLKRYPDGVSSPFFYEKRCPPYRPDWVATSDALGRHNHADVNYCVVQDTPTLVWVANLASLELHVLLSRAGDPSRPTMIMFDLDPGPPANILDCVRVALRLRDRLRKLGLECFPKTSGGKGLHVAVPLNGRVTFEQTKHAARSMAVALEHEDPGHVTAIMRRDVRPGKVFVDWSQNDQHKTTVCVYSLRAQERPVVSTPLKWSELTSAVKHDDAAGLRFDTDAVLRRVQKLGDLFAPVLKLRQKLPSRIEEAVAV